MPTPDMPAAIRAYCEPVVRFVPQGEPVPACTWGPCGICEEKGRQ